MKSIITLIATLVSISAFAQPAKNFPEPKNTETKSEAKAPATTSGKPMLLAKKKEDKKSDVNPNKSPDKSNKKVEPKTQANK